ncbi:MAG: hypothetical protein HOM14_00785 [Gammaproteobacteria bacterium]|nr:hypothetical protein [Gammaproteobacteria bacterium]
MEFWIYEYIDGLSPAEYHFQVSLLFIFFCFLIFKIYKTYNRYRFISDTATSKITSAAQGYVELKGLGEMMPGMELVSPFSHRRCLWYQCIVEKRNTTGKYTGWSEQSNETSDDIFLLKDDTSECLIIPEGAFVIPSEESFWYGSSSHDKTRGRLKSWLMSRYIGFGSYRFTEKLITVADPLYAIGLFKSVEKNSELNNLSKQVNNLVDQWKKNPLKYLKKYDVDNGKIQKQEWKLIRQAAITKIRENQQQTLIHILKNTTEKNQPFIISALSEKQLLIRKFRIIMLYLILCFVILIILINAIKYY